MKKFIATILTLTMAATCSVGVFAEEGEASTEATTEAATVASDATAAGAGSVDVVSTTAYRVVLPTDADLDYVADPEGLVGLADGSYSVSDLTGGNVYSNSTVNIANRSSKDIVVTAAVKATETSDNTVNIAVSDFDSIEDAAQSVALALVPSEATFTDLLVSTAPNTFDVEEDSTGSNSSDTWYTVSVDQATTGYEIGEDAISVPVALAAADYKIVIDSTDDPSFELVEGSVGGAVSFAVAGKCTTDYEDWVVDTANSETIGLPTLAVTYSFAEYEETEATNLLESADYAVDTTSIADNAVTGLAVSAEAAATVAISGTITVNGTSTVASTLTVTGLADGETISSVEAVYGTSNTNVGLVKDTHYTLGSDGNTITITAGKGWVTNVCGLSAGDEATLVVTTTAGEYTLPVAIA